MIFLPPEMPPFCLFHAVVLRYYFKFPLVISATRFFARADKAMLSVSPLLAERGVIMLLAQLLQYVAEI